MLQSGGGILAIVVGGWTITLGTLVTGALTGLTYAVLAAGLVLIYRATRVINFAHGEIGAFGAAVLAKLVLDEHWNFFLALILVLAVGGLLGGAVELGVVRRLFNAPRLVLLVATIGVSQLVFVGELLLPGIKHAAPYPTPLHRAVHLGGVTLYGQDFMVLAFVPAIIVGLALFLHRTPYGIAIRAAAENPNRAELAGISTRRVSTLVWVIAGVLSALTAVLINPVRGSVVGVPSAALGPSLLLRALAAAMAGGMVSLPLTLVGGVGIGVLEAVFFVNVHNPNAVDAALFVVVLGLVLWRGSADAGDESGWSLAPKVAAVPRRLRQLWWVRRSRLILVGSSLAVAMLLPLVFRTASRNYLFSVVVIYAIVGLSVTVLTGWAGQLSLGQFAFVGLGSMVTVALANRGMSFAVSVGYATAAGVVAALIIGFPALRVRGLFLAITTLAFAVAANSWLFSIHVLSAGNAFAILPRSALFGAVSLRSQRTYYYVCLATLVAAAAAVARLRRTGVGRSIVAVRDNDRAAASFTVPPALTKLTAFGLSGGLAALAGGLLAGLRVQFATNSFTPDISLQVVAMVVIGGLGSVLGAVLGAVYVAGLPALWTNSPTVGLLTSGGGLLVLLLYLPGGLAQIAYRVRDAVFASVLGRMPADPSSATETRLAALPRSATLETSADDASGAVLSAEGVTVRFGGRVALDGVTVRADRGEIVGLIGSNGAGKSTLMNTICGFIPCVSGRIEIAGVDVTDLAPHERAALGVGRVFQDARLFGDLTVRETIELALEPRERSELVPSLLGLPPSRRAERSKYALAAGYADFLGLGRYADSFIADLSTGTRRIVELCCLLAQGAQLLLLDEPTAGVAQRETEALGPLIKRVQSEIGATIVLIEHDIPLVMGISDRIYCLAAGTCIAEGRPEDVRHDPKVVAAYLGTDERALARSGPMGTGGAPAGPDGALTGGRP